MTVEIRVACADNWTDVEAVMGDRGGYAGCWCTFWRLTNDVIHDKTAEDNRAMLRELVADAPQPVGLILYHDGKPAGWCQVAPRPQFPRLFRTKALPLDNDADALVWAIVCVYLRAEARGSGATDALVAAAVSHAARQGATAVEAYPIAVSGRARRGALSSGTVNLFTRAGFVMPSPPTGSRVVMRYEVGGHRG